VCIPGKLTFFFSSERTWFEQGRKVGEHVIPLARNFNGTDVESGSNNTVCSLSLSLCFYVLLSC
jgi:hypothetical protein